MKPHIVFICNEYPPFQGGGIGTFYQVLSRELVRVGYRVTVGGVYRGGDGCLEVDQGVEVWRLPALGDGRGRYHLNMVVERLRMGRWVKSVLDGSEAGVVDTADYQGWMWGVPRKWPRIVRLHACDAMVFPLLGLRQDPLKRYLEISAMRSADYIVSSSNFMAVQARELLGPRRDVTLTIYNMVDTDRFSVEPSIPRESGTVASVASLSKKKGVYQLLQAWRQVLQTVPTAKLRFYGRDLPDGSGGAEAKLRRLAQEWGIAATVTFEGAVPYDHLPGVLQRQAVVAFPSYMEAHPRAWLEAMATGAPVIGSSRGPGVEVISDGQTGFLVDPDDTRLLAERIVSLLREPDFAGRLGAAAREDMLRRFSIDVVLRQNQRFYEACLERWSGRRPAARRSR